MNTQSVAESFLRAGCGLVPIPLGEKGPHARGWQRRENVIFGAENAATFEGQNAGIVHEYSRTAALDIDDLDAADAWLTSHGVNLEQLFMAEDAVSVSSGTPNRGKLLYRLPEGVAALRTVKLDRVKLEFRCAGSQDVIAGKHPSGNEYAVVGDPATMPELPGALFSIWRGLLGNGADHGGPNGADHGGGKIPEGGRNATLTSIAGSMRRRGTCPEAIEAALLIENARRCRPPLPEAEVRAITESVGHYAPDSGQAETNIGWPAPLDLAALAQRQPQPPRFLLADWLPTGYTTLFAGHGGVGKSAIGLHLSVCVAVGLPFFGIATERRRVLYLSCEDREGVLHWRLAHICAWLGLNMADLAGHLEVLDLVGCETVLWERDPRTGYTVTQAFNELAGRIERTRPGLLVIDGVSDTFGGNENARTEIKRYVNALLAPLGPEDALLLLGHVPKLTATNAHTSEGYSGSTQWHNAVRARWYLYPETEKDEDDKRQRTGKLTLELQKSNLGRTDQAMTFQWNDAARLFVASATFGTNIIDRKHREQSERIGILAALAGCARAEPPIIVPTASRGERTAFHVLSKRPEFPEALKHSTKRFWSRIEELRQLRQITEQENCIKHHRKTWHFVLTAEVSTSCDS